MPAHAVDVVALAATLNDHDSNFDSSANRSRRWRLQNAYGCRDNNREGHKRRKLREQQLTSPERRELRERRADAVRECRERDREAARRYGLKPSDQRWKEIKDERWQREQKQSKKRAQAEVSYYYSEDYMICKRARRGALEQLTNYHGLSLSDAALLCVAGSANATADPDESEGLLAISTIPRIDM